MRTEKKIIEFEMTIIVRWRTPPRAKNDNLPHDYWTEELKDLYDRYDK
jgi:hypothetical protein